MALVEIRDVDKSFKREAQTVDVYNGLTIDFEEGSFTALMGPSGSGKSTLLNLVAGLDKPTRGTVRVAGEEVSAMSAAQLAAWRARTIGFVFQSYNLLPVLTAAQNVELPLLLTNLGKKDRAERVGIALGVVGLGEGRSIISAALNSDLWELVRICDLNGTEFARGIAAFTSRDIQARQLKRVEVVHRDDLVIL